jgi:hypothetical protein
MLHAWGGHVKLEGRIRNGPANPGAGFIETPGLNQRSLDSYPRRGPDWGLQPAARADPHRFPFQILAVVLAGQSERLAKPAGTSGQKARID